MTRSRFQHPPTEQLRLPAVLHALSDPTRLEIARVLAERGEAVCGDFQHLCALSTLTHHFRVLRDAGVIRTEADGTCNRSALRREDVEGRFPGVLPAVLQAAEADR